MVNGTKRLPEGWKWTTVGECSIVITGRTPSKKDDSNYGNFMPFVKPPELLNRPIFAAEDNISEKGTKDARVLPVNSVLVSCIGNLGKTGISRVPVAFNQQINAVIFPENIIPEFGFYYFQSSEFKEQLEDISSATTVAIVNKSKFESLPFPIAPLPEQKRIVAKIEELFTQLEAGTSALERVQAGLRRYKASVLKAAVSGKLVNGNLGIGEDKLPGGWRWAKVEEIGDKDEQTVLTGPFGSNLGSGDFQESGVPVLTIGCLTEKGLNLDKAKYISEKKAKELTKYKVREGDFLFSRMATVGRAGLVTKQFEGLIFNYHLMRLRLDKSKIDLNYFLAYVRGSSRVTNYVRDVNHGATRDGINTEQLLGLPVALPPLEEQRRIVAEVEGRLSVARQVEAAVEGALVRASRLRQAVLRSAFEGRLGS